MPIQGRLKAVALLQVQQDIASLPRMNDPEALRDAVRAYFKSIPLTQLELAKELKVSPRWLTGFMTGELDNPTVKRLSKLAKWVEADRTSRIQN